MTNAEMQERFAVLQTAGYMPWGGHSLEGQYAKAPYGRNWQRYSTENPSNDDVERLFASPVVHLGIILPWKWHEDRWVKVGVVDCECEQTANEFHEALHELGPQLADRVHRRRNNRSMGEHVYFLYEDGVGIPKIRVIDPNVPMLKRHGDNDTIFEILGTQAAKYCIVEADGREHVSGPALESLDVLAADELNLLCQAALRVAELHQPQTTSSVLHVPRAIAENTSSTDHETAIDEFNRRFDLVAYMIGKGWSINNEDQEHAYLTRPGKTSGVSASIRKDNHVLHCFSTSTPLMSEIGYSPFQVYAELEGLANRTSGEYSAAVAHIIGLGYRGTVENSCGIAQGDKLPLILPGPTVSIEACAQTLFRELGDRRILLRRDQSVVEIVEGAEGATLETVDADGLCSRLESCFIPQIEQLGKNGQLVVTNKPCPTNTARQLIKSRAVVEHLPHVKGVSPIPLLTRDGRILGAGYDAETQWFISGYIEIETMTYDVAVQELKALLQDWCFATDSDYSRTIAAFLTPMYRFAGFSDRVPALWIEADDSQTGKSYLAGCVATLYGNESGLIAQTTGGVGSLDENIAMHLLRGKRMLTLDNLRGKIDSPYLEALITADESFSARAAYMKGELIDPKTVFLSATSNSAVLTRDQSNRVSIIRLQKQPEDYEFRTYTEGDLKEHIRANRGHYLGAVVAVLCEWINRGKPMTTESRHAFREWTRSMDWIAQNLFELAPLMDGYREARDRLSDPAMAFLRELAIMVQHHGMAMAAYSASELYGMCQRYGLTVPNLQNDDVDAGARALGKLMSKCFGESTTVNIDNWTVTRQQRSVPRDDGNGSRSVKTYRFAK